MRRGEVLPVADALDVARGALRGWRLMDLEAGEDLADATADLVETVGALLALLGLPDPGAEHWEHMGSGVWDS